MAIAFLVAKPSSIILPPKSTQRGRSQSKRPFYNPPTSSSSTPPLSHRLHSMHAAKPICALVKESSGFIGTRKWNDFHNSNILSFWDNLSHAEEKIQCHWRKEDAVGDSEEGNDTNLEEKKMASGTKRSWSKLLRKFHSVILGASFCMVLGIFSFSLPKLYMSRHVEVPYSDLVGGIRDGNVTRVQFVENSRKIYFNTRADEEVRDAVTANDAGRKRKGTPTPKWQYHTRNVEDDKYELLMMLKEKGVTYGSDPELLSGSIKNFLFQFLQLSPYWIMVILTFYQLNVQLNLSRLTKRKPSKKQSVTFNDVEGVDAAKAELLEIVLCMKGDNRYKKLGAKLPRGVLLAGPPGTGKTLLARAVAGEAGVSFFSISASELVEVFVGRGAARVRDLFRQARKHSPSIIFIDEIDAVGGQRGRTLNCERDQTLNQLLTDMDGFEKDSDVVVIAATNRPETLDSALMRPGRFSRKVLVDEPNEEGRRKIFGLYLRDIPMEEDKEEICNLVASLTPGLVGADLENIAHESVLLAARRGGESVTRDDVIQAVERATSRIYDNSTKAKPFQIGSMAQERVEFEDGAMGFGFSD